MIKHDGTRDIMMDNRRIGLSMTGIAQYTTNHGAGGLVKMLSENYDFVRHYDKRYSSWFGIPESVRVTSVKPSGTVSLVAGATPGVHYPHSEFYIRRIRMSDDSYLAPRLIAAGVHVEPDKYSRNTLVASFPIHAGIGIRSAKSLSIWEQLEMAAIMQRHWSDNAVSVTVSVNPSKTTNEELAAAISMYQNSLKTVSFLPEIEGGAYEQMPYEEITREAYSAMQSGINYSALSSLNQIIDDTSRMSDKYCDGAACEIVPKSQ
jgi:ribonucleotide reductase alpha subunit